MSLLSYTELVELVERGVITGVKPEAINAASIDVRLGDKLIIESESDLTVDIAKRTMWASIGINIKDYHYDLRPGEFALAQTIEQFNLPDDICAEFKLKSSGARSGLENSLATWCDCGWNGSVLTLELKNFLQYHPIRLTYGSYIGQMIFFRVAPVPRERSYGVIGRYNGDTVVQACKP